MIPDFNNLTHSYSLPAVSVFTAELLAISMALQHISAIPVTPFAIVICSESRAGVFFPGIPTYLARGRLEMHVRTNEV